MHAKTIVPHILLLMCCACAPFGHEDRAPRAMALNHIDSTATLGAQDAPTLAVTDADWSFGDPQLAHLFELGLKNAPQYAQVVSRVQKADALAGVQRAAAQPQVNGDASLSEAQTSRNLGLPSQFSGFLPKGLHSNSRLALSATLDADLFGRQRAAIAAAVSEAQATRFDQAAARQALIASIAQAYADYATAVDDAKTADAVAALRQRQLDLARLRLRAGLDDESVSVRASADARTAQLTADADKLQIMITRYRLAALVGEGPDFGATLAPPTLTVPHGFVDTVGMDVIANRPDVTAAKLRIEAQADRVKMARRDFYPNISLSALAGFQSFDAGQLLLGSSATPGFGAALHLPIFDSGRLKAAYRGQQADYDAAVAAYNGALTNALQDVSSSLIRLKRAQAQYATASGNLVDATRSQAIADDRERAQIVSAYNNVPVHLALLDAQARVADARDAIIAAQIDVLRALGGRIIQANSGDKQ